KATAGGNLLFGYGKVPANLQDMPPNTFNVRDTLHQPFFTASQSTFGQWYSNAQAKTNLPNYKDAMKIFRMPILRTFLTGLHVCSYFKWSFPSQTYKVRSISSLQSFQQDVGSIPETPNYGSMPPVHLGQLPTVTQGAFEMEGLRWRLGLPVPCQF